MFPPAWSTSPQPAVAQKPIPIPTPPYAGGGGVSMGAVPGEPPTKKYPQTQPSMPSFKVIDLGEIPSEKFEEILRQMSKAWGRDIAPLLIIDKPRTFKEQMKSDLTNAAYRVGSKQILVATKNFLVQYARKTLADESKIKAIAELLDTEIGTALMAMFIGTAVSSIPQLSNNPKMNRILKEFRVSGMSTIGNAAVQSVMASVLPVIGSALQGLEKVESTQIAEELTSLEEEMIVVSAEEKPAPLLRQS